MSSLEGQCNNQSIGQSYEQNAGSLHKHQIGENVSRKDKIKFLVTTLLDLKDSKESVYGALDAWIAWEHTFPIVSLKRALLALEKEQQRHRVVQVVAEAVGIEGFSSGTLRASSHVMKWMLSKGQGCTMGTYGQLIQALDRDHRAEEAHMFWQKKVGTDLHSVPWQLCKSMISIYYRNDMLERLIKLFKGLEAFDPEKSIVLKVANAYAMLGFSEEKARVLEKYKDLLSETRKERLKKSKTVPSKKNKKTNVNEDEADKGPNAAALIRGQVNAEGREEQISSSSSSSSSSSDSESSGIESERGSRV